MFKMSQKNTYVKRFSLFRFGPHKNGRIQNTCDNLTMFIIENKNILCLDLENLKYAKKYLISKKLEFNFKCKKMVKY